MAHEATINGNILTIPKEHGAGLVDVSAKYAVGTQDEYCTDISLFCKFVISSIAITADCDRVISCDEDCTVHLVAVDENGHAVAAHCVMYEIVGNTNAAGCVIDGATLVVPAHSKDGTVSVKATYADADVTLESPIFTITIVDGSVLSLTLTASLTDIDFLNSDIVDGYAKVALQAVNQNGVAVDVDYLIEKTVEVTPVNNYVFPLTKVINNELFVHMLDAGSVLSVKAEFIRNDGVKIQSNAVQISLQPITFKDGDAITVDMNKSLLDKATKIVALDDGTIEGDVTYDSVLDITSDDAINKVDITSADTKVTIDENNVVIPRIRGVASRVYIRRTITSDNGVQKEFVLVSIIGVVLTVLFNDANGKLTDTLLYSNYETTQYTMTVWDKYGVKDIDSAIVFRVDDESVATISGNTITVLARESDTVVNIDAVDAEDESNTIVSVNDIGVVFDADRIIARSVFVQCDDTVKCTGVGDKVVTLSAVDQIGRTMVADYAISNDVDDADESIDEDFASSIEGNLLNVNASHPNGKITLTATATASDGAVLNSEGFVVNVVQEPELDYAVPKVVEWSALSVNKSSLLNKRVFTGLSYQDKHYDLTVYYYNTYVTAIATVKPSTSSKNGSVINLDVTPTTATKGRHHVSVVSNADTTVTKQQAFSRQILFSAKGDSGTETETITVKIYDVKNMVYAGEKELSVNIKASYTEKGELHE